MLAIAEGLVTRQFDLSLGNASMNALCTCVRAGWALLGALLGARDADATTARDLLESPFFTVVPQRRKWRHTS